MTYYVGVLALDQNRNGQLAAQRGVFSYTSFNSLVNFYLLLLLSIAFYGPAGMASLVWCDQVGSIMSDAGDDMDTGEAEQVAEGVVLPTKVSS